jgi:iron(III) transport system ATP-binding protein
MTVGQNVVYPLKIARRSKRTIQEKLAATLRAAGLEKLVDRYPNQLSGGEQQRVALARALIKEPEVLLLDEPLSNLDAKLREQMRFELKELQRRTGVPILYVTHDQAEALAISDRLAVMSGGRIIQMGTPAEIYSDPANEFVASFIGIMNFLPCSVVSRNGETATVEIAGGLRIPVHDRSSPLGRALLAIRPEDVSFTDSGQIPCRIEIGHFLGSVIDYRVRIGEESLRVQTAKTQHFREGEERCLRIDRAMIFPLNQTAGAKEE